MAHLCKRITESDLFHRLILFLILLTAASMGVEAVPALAQPFEDLLFTIGDIVQALFVVEITLRLLAEAPKVQNFFRSRWNVFDFIIVGLSLIPAVGSFALIARLLRLVRVLRLLSVSARLRAFIDRLQQTFDEVAGATLVVIIVGYIFVISGHYLFSDIDPAHWGGLRESLMSVFYLLLFQNVPAFVDPLVARSLASLLFFALFYLTFIGLALCVIAAAVLQEKEKST